MYIYVYIYMYYIRVYVYVRTYVCVCMEPDEALGCLVYYQICRLVALPVAAGLELWWSLGSLPSHSVILCTLTGSKALHLTCGMLCSWIEIYIKSKCSIVIHIVVWALFLVFVYRMNGTPPNTHELVHKIVWCQWKPNSRYSRPAHNKKALKDTARTSLEVAVYNVNSYKKEDSMGEKSSFMAR